MQELIHITTDAQGASVVSARELYTFLAVKARFNDWFTRRIEKYGLVPEQDFVLVTQKRVTNNARNPTVEQTDYALTLDAAKELAMVEGNEQGKAARQYFIDCEKRLREVAAQPAPALPSATEQMMLGLMQQQTELAQQNAALIQHQQDQLAQLRSDINAIMQGQPKHRRTTTNRPPFPSSSSRESPLFGGSRDGDGDRRLAPYGDAVRLRQQIAAIIEGYSTRFTCLPAETYRYLYRRMQEVYGVNVYQLHKQAGQSYLDAIEAYGQLDRFYALLRAELAYEE